MNLSGSRELSGTGVRILRPQPPRPRPPRPRPPRPMPPILPPPMAPSPPSRPGGSRRRGGEKAIAAIAVSVPGLGGGFHDLGMPKSSILCLSYQVLQFKDKINWFVCSEL